MHEGAKVPARADLNEDFPLRGAIACADCGKPLTACWSRSKTGARHPYYMCFAKGCVRKGKSIRRERIEGEFVEMLETLTPTQRLFDLAHALFRDCWERRNTQVIALAHAHEREVAKIAQQIDTLLDRLVEASSPSVIAAYEKRVAELERSKLVLADKQQNKALRAGTFDELFELAMIFLSSPSKIWRLGKLEYQKLVLRLAFADKLLWSPETGFRTPQTTMPFKMLEALSGSKKEMAETEGFELVG